MNRKNKVKNKMFKNHKKKNNLKNILNIYYGIIIIMIKKDIRNL